MPESAQPKTMGARDATKSDVGEGTVGAAAQGEERITLQVEHRATGKKILVKALKTYEQGNRVTKACAEKLGFDTKPVVGQSVAWIAPIWTVAGCNKTFEGDIFVIVETADCEIMLGNESTLELKDSCNFASAAAVISWQTSPIVISSQASGQTMAVRC
jgi:hypothetical protein